MVTALSLVCEVALRLILLQDNRKYINFLACWHEDNVDIPSSVFNINQTLIFEWYMVACESKNAHQIEIVLTPMGLNFV